MEVHANQAAVPVRSFEKAAFVAGVISLVVGAVVLLGWITGSSVLQTVLPGWQPMRLSGALSFIGLGAGLLLFLRHHNHPAPWIARSGQALGAAVFLLNLAALVEEVWGWPMGVRRLNLYFSPSLGDEALLPVVPGTAGALLSMGLALVSLFHWPTLSQLLSAMTWLLWLAALIGHGFGTVSLAGLGAEQLTGLHTLCTGLVLCSGLLCARPSDGVMQPLVSSTVAGSVFRRLLPTAVVVPIIIGWAVLQGMLAGYYDPLLAVALTVVLTVAVLSAFLWWNAVARNRIEIARSEAEAAIREQTDLYRAVVNTAVDGIIIIDESGIIQSANPAAERIFGYSAAEMIGRNVKMLMPEPHYSQHDEYLRHYHRTGERRIIGIGREVEGRRKDGSIFPLDLAVSETQLRTHRVFTGLLRDISQRKQAEAALAAAQEELQSYANRLEAKVAARTARLRETVNELETITYTMAHDLRAPLRTMSGFSQILLEDEGPRLDENSRRLLQQIGRAAQRMDNLTRDLLAYARVARVEIKPEPVDLEAVADEVVQMDPAFAGVQIHVQKPLDIVLGHRLLLVQCLSNLLHNAVQYVAPGTAPQITLRTETRDGQVRLWIEDNGIGIDPQFHQKIFGVFERIEYDTGNGTGIGLAIVSKAVQRMHGQLGVESSPGAGSRFWIELPRAKQPSVHGE